MKRWLIIPLFVFLWLIGAVFCQRMALAGYTYQQLDSSVGSELGSWPNHAYFIQPAGPFYDLVRDQPFQIQVKIGDQYPVDGGNVSVGCNNGWSGFDDSVASTTFSPSSNANFLTINVTSAWWPRCSTSTVAPAGILLFTNEDNINFFGTGDIFPTSTMAYWANNYGNFYNYDEYVGHLYYAIGTNFTPLPAAVCDPNAPWYLYDICKLLVAAFVPDSSTLNQYAGLIEAIKYKPPIGYFYLIKDALTGLNSTTTPAVNLTFGPITTYIFTPIRTGLIFILWLIFGVWIFHRIRKIEL